MEEEGRQVNEQLRKGVESGSVSVVNDDDGSELKEEFRRFQFEFFGKTKSNEEKLPRKLRNGW